MPLDLKFDKKGEVKKKTGIILLVEQWQLVGLDISVDPGSSKSIL